MSFSAAEIERYARHIVLRDFGGPGQQRLAAASLLVIGAGGLGSAVIAYCAAAGVGRIGIVDDDAVALSNLQRQVIHDTAAVGTPKAASAAASVRRLNPHVAVEPMALRLDVANAADIVHGFDIVADCTDRATLRYVISDACFRAAKPLVTASVLQFDGSLTVLRPFDRAADNRPNPTYRCLFPLPPATDDGPACETLGVLGPMAGVMGTLQALAVVKEIAGLGSGLVGKLLLVDGRDFRFETVEYGWDPANPLNGTGAG
jgi:molybdopterin/thiamine biosynthesis adenylyltransferase